MHPSLRKMGSPKDGEHALGIFICSCFSRLELELTTTFIDLAYPKFSSNGGKEKLSLIQVLQSLERDCKCWVPL